MQKFPLLSAHSKNINLKGFKDFNEQCQEQYIDKMQGMGFKFQGYGSMGNHDNGAHVLIFEHTYGAPEFRPHWIEDLMQDDDGQPMAVCQIYFGTVWIFIPYCN